MGLGLGLGVKGSRAADRCVRQLAVNVRVAQLVPRAHLLPEHGDDAPVVLVLLLDLLQPHLVRATGRGKVGPPPSAATPGEGWEWGRGRARGGARWG